MVNNPLINSYLRGGPNHRHNTFCVKKSSQSGTIMHEPPLTCHYNVTRAPITLHCDYCYNSANVPLVTLLVLHAYAPRAIVFALRIRTYRQTDPNALSLHSTPGDRIIVNTGSHVIIRHGHMNAKERVCGNRQRSI